MPDNRMFSLSGSGATGGAAGLWPMARRMDEGQGGYRSGVRSPVGIGAAIAVHIVAVGVVLLVPREVYITHLPPSFTGRNIPIDPVPPEVTPDIEPEVKTSQPTPAPFTPKPDTEIRNPAGPTITGGERSGGDTGTGPTTIIDAPVIPPDPVFVEAGVDPRYAAGFQPAYPGAMIRLSQEGKVVVRVTIGIDGRVIDIEQVSATSEAFWLATQRHALRKWRFRPATRDGVPVTATRTLTVHFRLAD